MSSKPIISHFSFIFAQKLLNNWRSCSKENDKLQKFEFLILETQIIDLWSDDLLSWKVVQGASVIRGLEKPIAYFTTIGLKEEEEEKS